MNKRHQKIVLAIGVVLATLAVACSQPLETTMARHMLLQIPMLLAAGACIAGGWPRAYAAALAERWRGCDENGVTGLFAFMLVSAYWMIPKTLDNAALSALTDSAKFASLLLAGLLLPGSLSRANTIIQLFFIGNFSSMTAVAGMLYQDAPRRLCNLYLIDDQMIAGTGLVALGTGVALLWTIRKTAFSAGPATEQIDQSPLNSLEQSQIAGRSNNPV